MPDVSQPLPTPARPVVYLHVGGPKSGTTYLQEVLWRNREVLLAGGVCYPGGSPDAQYRAVQDLLGGAFHEQPDPGLRGAWQRLMDEVRYAEGSVVISHELLGLASADRVEAALATLRFADVHIVYTARDLARQIPSVWQEDLKNRHTLGFEEFVRGLRGDDPRPHWLVGFFWKLQSPARVLETWGCSIPAERVHVVTVPPPGHPPDLLWERFASTVGIDPARCDADVGAAANRSLGVTEANLLRRMNPVLAAELDWPTYQKWVKFGLTGSIRSDRVRSVPITLPAAEHPWVLERSELLCTDLRERGYDVVGDLDDLLPTRDDQDTRHPDDASDDEQLDAATVVVAGLIRRLAAPPPPSAPTPAPPPPPPLMLVRHAVQQASEQYPPLMWARRTYRLVKSVSLRAVGRDG